MPLYCVFPSMMVFQHAVWVPRGYLVHGFQHLGCLCTLLVVAIHRTHTSCVNCNHWLKLQLIHAVGKNIYWSTSCLLETDWCFDNINLIHTTLWTFTKSWHFPGLICLMLGYDDGMTCHVSFYRCLVFSSVLLKLFYILFWFLASDFGEACWCQNVQTFTIFGILWIIIDNGRSLMPAQSITLTCSQEDLLQLRSSIFCKENHLISYQRLNRGKEGEEAACLPGWGSIILANVRWLGNKMDQLHAKCHGVRLFKDASIIALSESWLDKSIFDSEICLDSFFTVQADRTSDSGKEIGRRLCVFINKRRCV